MQLLFWGKSLSGGSCWWGIPAHPWIPYCYGAHSMSGGTTQDDTSSPARGSVTHYCPQIPPSRREVSADFRQKDWSSRRPSEKVHSNQIIALAQSWLANCRNAIPNSRKLSREKTFNLHEDPTFSVHSLTHTGSSCLLRCHDCVMPCERSRHAR